MTDRERVDEAIATLPEREQQVIRLHYGFDDGQAKTLEEVGRVFGSSRQRAWQIEGKAIRLLRELTCTEDLRHIALPRTSDVTNWQPEYKLLRLVFEEQSSTKFCWCGEPVWIWGTCEKHYLGFREYARIELARRRAIALLFGRHGEVSDNGSTERA